MKITTIGTSHGDPTLTRNQSSTLIETQGRYYLVDAGEGVNSYLIRHGLRASMLNGVFITHRHIDHTSSLPVVIEQAKKYRAKNPDTVLHIQLPEARAVATLQAWIEANSRIPADEFAVFGCYRDTKGFSDGFIKVTPYPTNHLLPLEDGLSRSHALLIEAEGKRVLFSGDVSCDDKYRDFPSAAAKGCDIIFSELTHFKLEHAVEVLKDIDTEKLVFHHVGNAWQTPEGEVKMARMTAELPYSVVLSRDGMTFEI